MGEVARSEEGGAGSTVRATIIGVPIVRLITRPLRSADTYRRWAYLVLGGVLFVPVLLVVLVVTSLVFDDGQPTLPDLLGARGVAGLAAAALLVTPCLRSESIRTQQAQLVRTLVRGPVASDPARAGTGSSAVRAAAWLVLHLIVGFTVCLVTMVTLTEAALLARSGFSLEPATLFDDVWTVFGPAAAAGAWWRGPVAGGLLVIGTIYGVALLGSGAARLAPVLVGPSVADRLAVARAEAEDLVDRNRLAAELHDSIGHALSVVALQAGAAGRVIDTDIGFVRTALDAIADQARTATAELDHVLGVLRDHPADRAPSRTLADLNALVDAAHSTGAEVRVDASGPLHAIPTTLSRELYRLCQEGLTNALRHGEASTPITVRLDVAHGRVQLDITNVTSVRHPRLRGGGRGVPMMRRRVRSLGGDLEVGAHDGVWRLSVTVPCPSVP